MVLETNGCPACLQSFIFLLTFADRSLFCVGDADDLSSESESAGQNEDEAEDDQSGVPIIPVIFAILAAFGIGQLRSSL